MNARIAVLGTDAAATADISSEIADGIGIPVISSAVPWPSSTGPLDSGEFTHIRNALRDFEYRTDHEARLPAFVSDGSVLRFGTALVDRYGQRLRRLATRPDHVADLMFLRGFARAYEGIVLRHARVSYSSLIVLSQSVSGDSQGHGPLVSAAVATCLPVHIVIRPEQVADLIPSLAVATTPDVEGVSL
ncbi:MAG: hypothetical protein WAW17_00630 [Rhodococcus sp. (in: high G+C Gram-positive bacteria)]|uniref:hypothetical protein n=1 Tax=Rhodococcus sp. TaxID=1831 RepID=UPI003BB1F95D